MFPILYFLTKKWTVFALIISFFIIVVGFDLSVLPKDVYIWIFHFVIGITCALHIDKINYFLNRFNSLILFGILLLIFGFLFYLRNFVIIFYLNNEIIAPLLSANIVFLVLLTINIINNKIKVRNTGKIMKFLGNHSMNIYMIHTFIYHYWFSNFIYSFKYPILIFFVLLAICLIISVLLEYGKKIVHLPVIIDNINKKITKL